MPDDDAAAAAAEEEAAGWDEVQWSDYGLLLAFFGALALELGHLAHAVLEGKYDSPLERLGHVSAVLELVGFALIFFLGRRSASSADPPRPPAWDVSTIVMAVGLVGTLPHLARWVVWRVVKAAYVDAIAPRRSSTLVGVAVHLGHVASEASAGYRALAVVVAALGATWRFSHIEAERENVCLTYLIVVSGGLALVSGAVKRPDTLPSWLQPGVIGGSIGVGLGFLVGGWAVRLVGRLFARALATKSTPTLALLALQLGHISWICPKTRPIALGLVCAVDVVPFFSLGDGGFCAFLVIISLLAGLLVKLVDKLEAEDERRQRTDP